jgi:hypothetical protein
MRGAGNGARAKCYFGIMIFLYLPRYFRPGRPAVGIGDVIRVKISPKLLFTKLFN